MHGFCVYIHIQRLYLGADRLVSKNSASLPQPRGILGVWAARPGESKSIAPRPSGCATGHPSPPGALGLAAIDSFCRDRPALTCATSLSLARKLAQ
jgi:hypothetical protein